MPDFVSALAPDIRASLALFCYRRNHLHSMGLAIAASCDENDLVRQGGNAGAVLYACSKKSPARETALTHTGRREITLATGFLRTFAMDDESPLEAAHAL